MGRLMAGPPTSSAAAEGLAREAESWGRPLFEPDETGPREPPL